MAAVVVDLVSYYAAYGALHALGIERRGIKAAICAPMSAHGRVLGVLFFDDNAPKEGALDLRLAKDVADRCALLVERSAARM